jgi:hypothetical protein
MSCYDWEHGTIKIPASQWAKFRKGLLTIWNARQEELLTEARHAYDQLKAVAKGKRGDARLLAMKDELHRLCRGIQDAQGYWSNENSSDVRDMERLLFACEGNGWKRTKFRVPRRKDLSLHPVSKSTLIEFPDMETTVSLDNDTRSIIWDVPENRYAVKSANDHWFAKKMFAILRSIRWVRGSGGKIVGNDEYNQDSWESGGGGNYVTARYGPGIYGPQNR